MRNAIIILVILFGQCSVTDKRMVLIDSELNDSRFYYEQENRKLLDCLKFGINLTTKTDSLNENIDLKDLFEKLNQIFITKDSLIEVVSHQQDINDYIKLLENFKEIIIDQHKPKYPTKQIELYLEKDLIFIKANIRDLPYQTYTELFKHIIERWTNESYTSFLQSWAIDYPC